MKRSKRERENIKGKEDVRKKRMRAEVKEKDKCKGNKGKKYKRTLQVMEGKVGNIWKVKDKLWKKEMQDKIGNETRKKR